LHIGYVVVSEKDRGMRCVLCSTGCIVCTGCIVWIMDGDDTAGYLSDCQSFTVYSTAAGWQYTGLVVCMDCWVGRGLWALGQRV
jgi:hypothetical protein